MKLAGVLVLLVFIISAEPRIRRPSPFGDSKPTAPIPEETATRSRSTFDSPEKVSDTSQTGCAVLYSSEFDSRRPNQVSARAIPTAGHRSLALGTTVLVTNSANQRTVTVRVSDRLKLDTCIIALTEPAAVSLGISRRERARVTVSPL